MSDFFPGIAWLIPFLPLLGAGVAVLGPRRMRTDAHVPVAAGIALAFLVSLGLLFSAGPNKTITVMHWLTISNFDIPIEFRIDGLTTIMLSMVTFVSSLVAIYAVGYMHADRGYWRFFTYVSLFEFSMTMLVSVSNEFLVQITNEALDRIKTSAEATVHVLVNGIRALTAEEFQ